MTGLVRTLSKFTVAVGIFISPLLLAGEFFVRQLLVI